VQRQRATTAASFLVAPVLQLSSYSSSAAASCWLLLLLDSFPVRGWRWSRGFQRHNACLLPADHQRLLLTTGLYSYTYAYHFLYLYAFATIARLNQGCSTCLISKFNLAQDECSSEHTRR
jgi:hypothetical protein